MHFQNIHPEALRRLDRLDREIATAAWETDVDRQSLDGIPAQRPELPQVGRGLHCDAQVPERTIELDRGFGVELSRLGEVHRRPGCPAASRPRPWGRRLRSRP